MAVSLLDFLPPDKRPPKPRTVSADPTTFRPEHDYKWELEHNREAHTYHPDRNPGNSVGVYRFPQNMKTLGIDRIDYAISSRRRIGIGPHISTAVTLGARYLEGTKPIQQLTVLHDRRNTIDLPMKETSYVRHCLDYRVPLFTSGPGTTKVYTAIPAQAYDSLTYYADILGLGIADTILWCFALALMEQPEVHPQLRHELENSVGELVEVLFIKSKAIRGLLESLKKPNF